MTSANGSTTATTIAGTLDSTANSSFILEFFANGDCDASGFGEGKTFIGSTTVTTDNNCNAGFSVTLPIAIPAGQSITATATDSSGDTSEFSSCKQVSGPATNIQFSVGTYSVGEGDGSAAITVMRTGDTSQVVTVDYSASNGTADQRTDYTNASGTLNFNAGETSKTFPVLIVDDAYTEGGETVNLTLSNATGGATLGGRGSAMLMITDNDSVPPTVNPIDQARFFVQQHYYDFLNRFPDQGGWDYWTNQIALCGADDTCTRSRRIAVSNAFFYESEFQQTGAYVFRLYRAAFGDNQPFPNPDNSNQTEAKKLPSYIVFAPDRARVVGGPSLAAGQQTLANAFVQRNDFLAQYPANQDGPTFVDALLTSIRTNTGVDLTSERMALVNLFDQSGGGPSGRGAVLYRLADDNPQNPINNRSFIDEEYNRSFVFTQYAGYLRRDADIGGFLFWLGQINTSPLRDTTRQQALVCAFTTSAEYQLRFSSIVNHANNECSQ